MVVCQYFLRGQCRFGDSCRNEHPANPRSGFGNQSWTNTNTAASKLMLPFTQETMKSDLSPDKPLWPLSSYGPAKQEPNFISGLDESMEELRVRAVLALKAGNVNEYTTYESGKIQAADQIFANTRNNLSQAYQTAANQSPLIVKQQQATTSAFGSTPTAGPSTSAFGQTGFGSQPQSAFGQPSSTPQSAFSAFQSKPSTTSGATFGQSSFGQPQQSAFGQTSSLIKPASGAFGAFANMGPSPFAAAAQNSGNSGGGFSAFSGQSSAFGSGAQNTTGGSGFGGGGGTNATTNGFGAPAPVFDQSSQPAQSVFGAAQSQPTSVFGQPSQPSQSVFGQPSQPQTQSVFGQSSQQPQSAFGQPVQSAFGAPPQNQPQSVFGSGTEAGATSNPLNPQPTQSSVFTPLSSAANPLNAGAPPPQQQQRSSFGSTNPLGAAPAPTPFSAFTNGPTAPNPFTTPSTTTTTTSSFPTSTPSSFPTSTINNKPTNPLRNPTTKPDFANAIARVKAKPGITPYDSLLPPEYAKLLPVSVVEAFKSRAFEFGKVPDWVPPVEWR